MRPELSRYPEWPIAAFMAGRPPRWKRGNAVTSWTTAAALWLALVAAAAAAGLETALTRLDLGFGPAGCGEGAWVEAFPLDGDSDVIFLVPEQGAATRLDLSSGRWLVCSGGQDFPVGCTQVWARGAPITLPLGSTPGLRLTGRVVRGQKPLEAVQIGLFPEGLTSRRFYMIPVGLSDSGEPVRTVASAADGTFVTPPLAPGSYRLEITAKAGSRTLTSPVEVSAPQGQGRDSPQPLDLGDIAIAVGVPIAVQVIEPPGIPVENAVVGIVQGEDLSSTVFFRGTTDDQGLVVIDGLDPLQPINISARASGYLPTETNLDRPVASEVLELLAHAALTGQVVDTDADAVHGATISCSGLSTTSDKEGSFTLIGLEPREAAVLVAAPGLVPERREVRLVSGQTIDLGEIELLPGRVLSARVVEKGSGTPVDRARLTVVEPLGLGSATTDASGEFEITVAEDGPTRLEIEAPGFPEQAFSVPPDPIPEEERNARRTFEIQRGGLLDIVASSDDGPCAGCSVQVMSRRDGDGARVTTGMDGTASTEALEPGPYRVVLERVQSIGSVVQVEGGVEAVDAEVVAGGRTLVRLGGTRVEVRVVLDPPPIGWLLEFSTPLEAGVVAADGDGTYRIRVPREAPLDLALVGTNGAWIAIASSPAEQYKETIRLLLPRGELVGSAEWMHATQLALTPLFPGGRPARTSLTPGAAFRLPFLVPGPYSLRAGSTEDIVLVSSSSPTIYEPPQADP